MLVDTVLSTGMLYVQFRHVVLHDVAHPCTSGSDRRHSLTVFCGRPPAQVLQITKPSTSDFPSAISLRCQIEIRNSGTTRSITATRYEKHICRSFLSLSCCYVARPLATFSRRSCQRHFRVGTGQVPTFLDIFRTDWEHVENILGTYSEHIENMRFRRWEGKPQLRRCWSRRLRNISRSCISLPWDTGIPMKRKIPRYCEDARGRPHGSCHSQPRSLSQAGFHLCGKRGRELALPQRSALKKHREQRRLSLSL